MGFWISLSGIEKVFMLCAVAGGIVVLYRLVMQFVGADGDDGGSDLDSGGDGDLDAADGTSDISFDILSLMGLSSFFMMFGLVGLALYRQNDAGATLSVAGGFIAGCAAIWIMKRLFRFIGSLQSSGTLENSSAVGCEGTVYLTIPEGGTGLVSLLVGDRQREFDAVSENNETLPTGLPVRAVRMAGNVVVVQKIIG